MNRLTAEKWGYIASLMQWVPTHLLGDAFLKHSIKPAGKLTRVLRGGNSFPCKSHQVEMQEISKKLFFEVCCPFKVYFLFQRKKKNWKCSLVIKSKQKKHYKIVFSENNSYPNSPV